MEKVTEFLSTSMGNRRAHQSSSSSKRTQESVHQTKMQITMQTTCTSSIAVIKNTANKATYGGVGVGDLFELPVP